MNGFLAFAFRHSAIGNKILCPCKKCVNSFWREAGEVREHLICDGFLKGYTTWTLHGEASSSFVNHGNNDDEFSEHPTEDDAISELLKDLACGLDDGGDMEDDGSFEEPNEDTIAIRKLAEDNSQELYPGCQNYSKLRFLVRLLAEDKVFQQLNLQTCDQGHKDKMLNLKTNKRLLICRRWEIFSLTMVMTHNPHIYISCISFSTCNFFLTVTNVCFSFA